MSLSRNIGNTLVSSATLFYRICLRQPRGMPCASSGHGRHVSLVGRPDWWLPDLHTQSATAATGLPGGLRFRMNRLSGRPVCSVAENQHLLNGRNDVVDLCGRRNERPDALGEPPIFRSSDEKHLRLWVLFAGHARQREAKPWEPPKPIRTISTSRLWADTRSVRALPGLPNPTASWPASLSNNVMEFRNFISS